MIFSNYRLIVVSQESYLSLYNTFIYFHCVSGSLWHHEQSLMVICLTTLFLTSHSLEKNEMKQPFEYQIA